MNPYDFDNYKDLLTELIASRRPQKRGAQSAMARVIQCQPSFITQVLKGDQHFSMEQAERIACYFGLEKDHLRYFLLLVQYQRAGTASLRKVLAEQVEEAQQQQNHLAKRLKFQSIAMLDEQATYYSTWTYAACHVLVSLPTMQTIDALAAHLQIPVGTVMGILHFLCEAGLVKKSGDRYTPGNTALHLNEDSPFINQHHLNWRLQAMQALHKKSWQGTEEKLHFSTVFTLSKKDLRQVRDILLRGIKESSTIIEGSREEVAYALNLDLFQV